MKVLRQIEIDDKQRHREGENAVGQGIEPAFRNKLLGFNHHPFPVFQSNLRRYVSWRGNPEQSDVLLKLAHSPICSSLPARLYLDHSHCHVLAPATLAALPSTRAIPIATCSMSLIPSAPLQGDEVATSWRVTGG